MGWVIGFGRAIAMVGIINYAYDHLNRNTREVWLDQAGNRVHTFDFQYDAASQLLNAHDPNSAYSYKYDLDGRVTKVDNTGTPGVPNVVLDYTYDAVDNLTQVNDSIDVVAQGVENFTYDQLDRVTKITQAGDGVSDKRVDYTYDQASQMTGMSRYSDLTGNNLIAESNYQYDVATALYLINEGEIDDLAVIVNSLNIIIDLAKTTKLPMPSEYKHILYQAADYFTFSKEISAFFESLNITRIQLFDVIIWCIGAIVIKSKMLTNTSL